MDDVWGFNNPPDSRALLINWGISYWCNFNCPYCFTGKHTRRQLNPISQFFKGSLYTTGRILKGKLPYSHAFDNYSSEAWCQAFQRFSDTKISLIITGGEPFLDYRNFAATLKRLTEMEHIKAIKIETNGSCNIPKYSGVDSSKVRFMLTYHPTQISFEQFSQRVFKMREKSINIAWITMVGIANQVDEIERLLSKFHPLGIPININPDTRFQHNPQQHDKNLLEILYQLIDEFDVNYRTGLFSTKGKLCRRPMIGLKIDPTGDIYNSCFRSKKHNIFSKGFVYPTLLSKEMPKCPCNTCHSTHMYPFLQESSRYLDTLNVTERFAKTALKPQQQQFSPKETLVQDGKL